MGNNEVLEIFPVGRRIAFDSERGRLWVVCRTCERWNLSPLDERWEALDECERLFGNAKLRTSTENIGLAKLSEGLELVRIGAPLRPEFAAWRYGDQFGRRRRSRMIKTGAALAIVGGAYAGLGLAGFGFSGLLSWSGSIAGRIVKGNPKEKIAKLQISSVHLVDIRRNQLKEIRIVRRDHGWGLMIPETKTEREYMLEGDEAESAVRVLLPAVNRYGGSKKQVAQAVQLLQATTPSEYINDVAKSGGFGYQTRGIADLPFDVRLALEMSSHEEAERRALQEGELMKLEDEWKRAEEIASISDEMFMPASLMDRMNSWRKK